MAFDDTPEDDGSGGPDRQASYDAGREFGMAVASNLIEELEDLGDVACPQSAWNGLLRVLIGFWACDRTDAEVEAEFQVVVDDAMRDRAEFHKAHPEADPNAEGEG